MKNITQFTSIESFTTPRLLAERIMATDLDKLIKLYSNPEVMATLGGLRTLEKTQENLRWNLAQWDDNGFGLWLFYLKDTEEWVGTAGIRLYMIGGQEEIELSYALQPPYWHQGLATEMALACTEIAIDILHLDNIACATLTTNLPSQRVMEKAGFHYERDIIHADLPHVLYRRKN
jgi:[ribosomal protein S5]-alanine N-acetyltransferase